MKLFNGLFSKKESRTQSIISFSNLGRAAGTPRDYENLAREGYQRNIIAYRCISLLAQNAAAIPWYVMQGDKELVKHPLIDLLNRPNVYQGSDSFFSAVYSAYLISGNTYIEKVRPTDRKPPKELYSLRPDRMRIVPGQSGVAEYQYKVGSNIVSYPSDAITGKCEIAHVKTFNPLDDWYGMSPLEAVAYSIDQHNEASKWNFSLLRNSCKPSGVLEYTKEGAMTDDQFNRLKTEIDDQYSGASRAGRPMLLEGGLKWAQTMLNAKEMDWLAGKDVSAREIALGYSVPPQLVGIPDAATFANYQEARLALYEDAILPIVKIVRDELNRWLAPDFGDNIRIDFDEDQIPALSYRRDKVYDRLQKSDFLTINEKRAAVGYEPVDGGDEVMVQAAMLPLGFSGDDTIVGTSSDDIKMLHDITYGKKG